MADENAERDDEGESATVGSGRVNALFDDLESTAESLSEFADDVESVRGQVTADEGEVSGHVEDRITQDAAQLAEQIEDNTERLREELDELQRSV